MRSFKTPRFTMGGDAIKNENYNTDANPKTNFSRNYQNIMKIRSIGTTKNSRLK